jgi:hypothetical protein
VNPKIAKRGPLGAPLPGKTDISSPGSFYPSPAISQLILSHF